MHYSQMTFDKNEDTIGNITTTLIIISLLIINITIIGFNYRIHPDNKYISLQKRSKFIIRILHCFLANVAVELNDNYYYHTNNNDRGRDEFRSCLCQYIYSCTGSRPRLEYRENAINKYAIFEK